MPDHDVAIVGAGPVGLLLACLLAQDGIDVAVYERRPGADERSRAIGIHPPGQAALDAAGVGEAVRGEALELDGGDVLCGGRVLASVSFTAPQRVRVLAQHRTHTLLRERLTQLRPDALRPGQALVDFHDDGDVVRLRFDAPAEDVTASILVAADGVRSGIRGRLGIAWREVAGAGSYVMADVPDDRPDRRASLHCESDGIVESFPMPQRMRRWVLADPKERLHDAAEFESEIARRTGIRPALPDGMRPTRFRARQHRAVGAAVGRVVLVGDALHETSPIGGQGMNLGWAGAQRLAVAIRSSMREAAAPDLHEYGRSALHAAAIAQRRSRFYMTMGRPARGAELAARNALIRMLGVGPLRARTADMVTMRAMA